MRARKSYLDHFLLYPITFGLMAVVLLPVLVAVLGAFVNLSVIGGSQDQWRGSDAFSLVGFDYLFRNYGSWIGLSLRLAILSVLLCLLVAVPAGYVLVRFPFPGSKLIEELALLPLSLPGITVSIALLAAYGSARGLLLVASGHLLYTLPFMLRVVTGTLRSFDVANMENAAQNLGANFFQRLIYIVLPNLRHAIVVGSLLVFAVSWGEFNVSYLLNSGHPQTFPAALYNTFANESIQNASAAMLIFLAVVVPAVLTIQWIGGRSLQDIEQGA